MRRGDAIQPRGIWNVSGVACHLTSALQLLCCVVHDLRKALCTIHKETIVATCLRQQKGSDTVWFEQLVEFFFRYTFGHCSSDSGTDDDEPLDPSSLYRALEGNPSLAVSPHELGDAATGIRLLLQAIRQTIDGTRPEGSNQYWKVQLQSILNQALTGGLIQQELVGNRIVMNSKPDNGTDSDPIVVRQVKSGNERSMTCPFVVSGSCASLSDALAQATIEPTRVTGYVWPNQPVDNGPPYSLSSDKSIHNDITELEWTTHKTIRFTKLPRNLLLQPQRFSYRNGTMVRLENAFHIPRRLDMAPYCDAAAIAIHNKEATMSSCCVQYDLTGAILHVASEDEQLEHDKATEEQGHYVTIVHRGNIENDWVLLDDERIRDFDRCEVEAVFHGDPASLYCATVLAYQRGCTCDNKTSEEALGQLRRCLQGETHTAVDEDESVDWSRPQGLVGRRLRIRWANEKYFPGMVQSYNEMNGKHTIQYDDGDIRLYYLRRKNIQWDDV